VEVTGKRVLVIGFGALGSGRSAAALLQRKGAQVIANDIKPAEELDADTVRTLRDMGAETHFGIPVDSLVAGADLIVASPAVPLSLPFADIAKEKGVPVVSELELASWYCPCPILAITGTNGKTTTTALVGKILKTAGIPAAVCGNIGVPFSGQVEEMDPAGWAVVEVSSFQLEGVDTFHPRIAAVLNITPDHLDRHDSFDRYMDCKTRIFQHAGPEDFTVLNADDPYARRMADRAEGRVLFFSRTEALPEGAWVRDGNIVLDTGDGPERVCPATDLFIPGAHNLENGLAAALLSRLAGADTGAIAAALKSFKGVAHRIEFVRELDGIKYFNDSKGTNPDAAIRAVRAMKGPTVLIAGGYDKHADFSEWVDGFDGSVQTLILIGETADQIEETVHRRAPHIPVMRADSLEDAVDSAHREAAAGGNVLLSPACASWDMFHDYEQRGDLFKQYVLAL
jgi:UDP-N-acetylmuramoylalanine--D-glutamate ligase